MLRIITSACNQRLQLGLKGIICSRIVNFINYRSEALRSLSSICCKRKLRPQNQTICQRQCHNDTRSAIQLMDFPVIFRPSLVYSLKNVWMSALIRSFDQTFSANSFLGQAQQAVYVVSNLIADGEFEKLHGLVTEKALYEIESNHARLNDEQRNFIRIKEGTIHVKYLYQIGMIMDMPDQRLVEVTTVMQGLHGQTDSSQFNPFMTSSDHLRENGFLCNYRFIRDYSPHAEDEWTINVANHVRLADVKMK